MTVNVTLVKEGENIMDKKSVKEYFEGYTDGQIHDRILSMAMSDDQREVDLSVKLYRAWFGKCPVGDMEIQ